MITELYAAIRPALFRLDAEEAHHLTLVGLGWAERLGLARLMMPAEKGRPVRAMGIEFPNVVGLAAGLDKTGTCVDGFAALGFGHIEVGTITPRPQPGNPAPRLFRLIEREAIINRMGFNNPGLDQALRNIAARKWKGIVGFNIGRNFDTPNDHAIDDYLAGLRGAYAHVDYVTVNVSSPNTKGLRDLQQQDPLRALIRALKSAQAELAQKHRKFTPLAIKIAPDLTTEELKQLAGIFLGEKIDGVIATNTTISRESVGDDALAREAGGLSGRPMRAMATAVIRQLKSELGDTIPIIGVGGIMTAADAVEKIHAGAALVQLYSGLVYTGPGLVGEIIRFDARC